MGKKAFIFPGQGSQYIGMGKDFYDNFDEVKEIFETAKNTCGKDLAQMIFNGSEEDLKATENTQPAIYTLSIAIAKVLKNKGIVPEITAGHSLGEYTALTVSDVLDLETGLKLVSKRGSFISEACKTKPGGMIAVIGLDITELEDTVVSLANSLPNHIAIANYNSPMQTVVSYGGDDQDCEKIIKTLTNAGAKRAIKLNVAGAFHSALMNSASEKMNEELNKHTIKEPKLPIIFNQNSKYLTNIDEIKDAMTKQINHPVQWIDTIKTMVEDSVDTIIEVGPGKVLSGLCKKIHRELNIYNVGNLEDLDKLLK